MILAPRGETVPLPELVLRNLPCMDRPRRRILVVEDELFIAMLLEEVLQEAGYDTIGPIPRLDLAMVAARTERMDAALLDINLRGELVFPVARMVMARHIPFVFCSGYTNLSMIPVEFRGAPQVAKPYDTHTLLAALALAAPA